MSAFSYANLANLPFMEELYEKYLADPSSVDPSWRYFFEGMSFASKKGGGEGSADLRIYLLISAYRSFGHLMASFNPIAMEKPEEPAELKLETLGFTQQDLSSMVPTCGFLKEEKVPLKTLIEALRRTYCGKIGVECTGLGNPKLEAFIQKRIEPNFELALSKEDKMGILHYLNKAEIFESFLHTKYVGQKRFSLEGAETLIPMLAAMLDTGAEESVQEVMLGMAHRGRLNVLANILNKSYALIFNEFEDHYSPELNEGTGDVKYHKGFTGSLTTKSGKNVSVVLAANPSHLEAVDPVVEGQVRAKQEIKGDKTQRKEVIPILIHGDAAVSGQGIVYETLQLCKLTGYATGGTLHLVINNQIGFTTLPKDGRSTRYCTDIAKAFGSPVFHVNAEDPEGCVAVAILAMQIRQAFACDVFIDLGCYRKYGHNEGDEPTFTQPLEYQIIKQKPLIHEVYQAKLIQEGVLSQAQAETLAQEFRKSLDQALDSVQQAVKSEAEPSKKETTFSTSSVATAVESTRLISLAKTFCSVPETFHIHPKVQRLLKDRLAMVEGDPSKPLVDWGMAEHLAYASLLLEGIHVRLSGQDVRRGTFSHRHSIWIDQENEQKYFPLSHLSKTQAPFDVFNSPLSEYGVLGFEFGYSFFYPKSLVLWEAQYGDFGNGAQIVVDQFIVTSEQKWTHRCNLTLLLPHGYEGNGPEHSSGRIERFLQLSGEENIRVVNTTTPAQLFHLLRRQALDPNKKPLILFTPKAMLRYPQCVSPLNALSSGSFEEILDDPSPPTSPNILVFCSGKVFYDLASEREKRKNTNIVFIRIEQLYPFPKAKVQKLLEKYKGITTYVWAQEEHSNMGPWEYICPHLEEITGKKIDYRGRARSAAPATGSHALHKRQQVALMEEIFRTT